MRSCEWAPRVGQRSADHVPAIAFFDHEEVGSSIPRAAPEGPVLLADVLERIVHGRVAAVAPTYHRAISRAPICVSADMAHATHPNYVEKPRARPPASTLNAGPVIKINSNQRYATEGETEAVFQSACERAGVPFQKFVNRTDLSCGSTIGPMTAAKLGMRVVDVGNPQLAMHSARELCGSQDPAYMVAALEASWAEGETPCRRPGPPSPNGSTAFGCRHLSITHQPDWPYACGLFGMRSRMLPSIEVLKSSGEPCRGFEEKPPRPPARPTSPIAESAFERPHGPAPRGQSRLDHRSVGGIGRALAESFAGEGARVALHAGSNLAGLQDWVAEQPWRARARSHAADLRDADGLEAAARGIVDAWGRLDACVANAGVWPPADEPLHRMAPERLEQTIAVDLVGPLLTARAFLGALASTGPRADGDGASLVFVGSTAGRFGERDHVDYAAAKAGLHGAVQTLKNEIVRLDPYGRVNLVEPGWTVTHMAKPALEVPERSPAPSARWPSASSHARRTSPAPAWR